MPSTPSSLPILVDSDNALGSPWGDVDDAFALTALLRSGLPIAAIASVGGNTSESLADRNNRRLGALLGFEGPYLRGVEADAVGAASGQFDREGVRALPSTGGWRIAALGPLTNVAALLRLVEQGALSPPSDIVAVGGTLKSRGRWPPWWPHEFNLTHDLAATKAVFEAEVPLTLVPLDVARRLRVGLADLATLRGKVGEVLRRGARRWCWRSILVRGSSRFPVFDLVAAFALAEPERVAVEEMPARLHRNGWVEFGTGERSVRVVTGIEPREVWARFEGVSGLD